MYIYVGGHIHAMVCMWRSEDNFGELVLSFHQMGPEDRTWITQLRWQMLLPAEPSCCPRLASGICQLLLLPYILPARTELFPIFTFRLSIVSVWK